MYILAMFYLFYSQPCSLSLYTMNTVLFAASYLISQALAENNYNYFLLPAAFAALWLINCGHFGPVFRNLYGRAIA